MLLHSARVNSVPSKCPVTPLLPCTFPFSLSVRNLGLFSHVQDPKQSFSLLSDCQSFLHLQVMMCINHVLCNYTAVVPHTVALILPVPGGSERRAPHNSFGWLNSEKSPHTPQIAHKQKGQDKTQASGLLPESSFPAPSTLRGPCAI